MAGHTILLNLCGGVALLLWGTHVLRSAILRAFAAELRAIITRAAAGSLRAAATGVAAAAALQSATATAVLLADFAGRGLIALPAALALMLGADLGTTLAVQALSLDLSAVGPVLLVAGVATHRLATGARTVQVGRLLVGLALILLALKLVVAASAPLRESELTLLVLSRLAGDPSLALVVGALLTWLMHSSVAFMLFVVSLAASGLIGLPLAVPLVLGANVGSGLVALGLALRGPVAARRVLWGNLAFRACAALVALAALAPLTAMTATLAADPGRAAAHLHTLFNLVALVVYLPLTPSAAKLLTRLLPDAAPGQDAARLDHLDPALFDQPPLALNAATRAVLALADKVELMLREAIRTFEETDPHRLQRLAGLEDAVDAAQEEIKLYLARLVQRELSAEEAGRALELVLFTTNLEHIGDIIDGGLLRLAAKKQKRALRFSPAGWQDIRGFHAIIAEQMRRALTVFVTRDTGMARTLVAQKDRLRDEELLATERHFARLSSGTPETIESSALHLDVLRDLKRINAHLTTVAYPILEGVGELSGSRLRARDAADPLPLRARA